eukprot:6163142-Amphidinium_carterae.1
MRESQKWHKCRQWKQFKDWSNLSLKWLQERLEPTMCHVSQPVLSSRMFPLCFPCARRGSSRTAQSIGPQCKPEVTPVKERELRAQHWIKRCRLPTSEVLRTTLQCLCSNFGASIRSTTAVFNYSAHTCWDIDPLLLHLTALLDRLMNPCDWTR